MNAEKKCESNEELKHSVKCTEVLVGYCVVTYERIDNIIMYDTVNNYCIV